MSCWIKREAVLIFFLILCDVPRNLIAREIVLSTDFVYSYVSGVDHIHGEGESDATAADLARDAGSMRLAVLERQDYGFGIGRRLRMIRCEERFRDITNTVMPLPASQPKIAGVALSPPGDGLLLLSPDASYCGVFYEQQDDAMLDHYQFILAVPKISAISKRIWTPLLSDSNRKGGYFPPRQDSWVSRWLNKRELLVTYTKRNDPNKSHLFLDSYVLQTEDIWKHSIISYEIREYLNLMAAHHSKHDNTLALVAYREVPGHTQWSRFNNPSKRILWKVDLEKVSISELDLGVGYAPQSLFQFDRTYGYWTQYIDHSQWSEELLKLRTDRYTNISVVMLHEGKTLKRDFQSSSDVHVHALPEMGLILCCFDTDRGIPLTKQNGDAEPREIDFEEGFERTLRWNDASNWLFLDAKTLDIVDNWIIDKDIYPFTYSDEYQKLIAKSTKYKMRNPPGHGIESYQKDVIEQKIFLLSFRRK